MSGSKDDGGQAFPRAVTFDRHEIAVAAYPGMTLRDYFAAQALGSLLANGQFLGPTGLFTHNGASPVAEAAYMLADAMMAERPK